MLTDGMLTDGMLTEEMLTDGMLPAVTATVCLLSTQSGCLRGGTEPW